MLQLRLTVLLALTACLFNAPSNLRADVKLPTVIDSHMVLQRDAELKIWGWSDSGEKVTVTLDAHSASTTGDEKFSFWSLWSLFESSAQVCLRSDVTREAISR